MSLETEEDWMRCAEWMVRCGVVSAQLKNNLSSIEHLASIVKDGVLLCNLLNSLKPGCIKPNEFSSRPQASYFLGQKNVKAFLRTCKTHFGLKDESLFDPSELLSLRDFKNVINTLSKLSQCRELRKRSIDPFYADSNAEYIIIPEIMDECEDEYSSSIYGFPVDSEGVDNELIYDTFVSVQQKSKDSLKKTKKERCLEELVDTEKNFLDALDSTYKFFYKPLKSILSPKDFMNVFNNFDEIKAAHTAFNRSLLKAKSSPNPTINTAECFIESKSSFVVYGEYLSKLPNSQLEIKRLTANDSKLANQLEKSADKAKVKLHDILIIPSQRILKYHLIIRELIKHSQDNAEEMVTLKKALEVMEDLGVYMNEVKRDYEKINNIHEIKKSIKDIDKYYNGDDLKLEGYGRLHFDGCFKIKEVPETKYSRRYLFLFDKVLIICESYKHNGLESITHVLQNVFRNTIQNPDNYSYKRSIAIMNCVFEKIEDANKKVSPIRITDKKDDTVELFITGDLDDSLNKLLSYLQIARDNTRPLGSPPDIILSNFKEPSECSVCHKLLRGLLSQGYLCKSSNRILHKECLPKSSKKTLVKKETKKATASDKKQHSDSNWFSTAQSRNEASNILRSCALGTFLVRWSKDSSAYAISIKTDRVRHMVVKKDHSGYYLKSGFTFKTIDALVDHYRHNSLEEAFSSVKSALLLPFKEIRHEKCRALYDFSATEARQLTFQAGDIIEIISKRVGGGCWRGKLNDKRGNFPLTYVELID